MSEDCAKKSHLIVVKWKPKEIKEDRILTFISAKSDNPKVQFGRKNTALVQFDEKNKQNVDFLRKSWKDDKMWTIEDIYGIPPTRTVKVSNLPESASRADISKFFTNTLNVQRHKFDPTISEHEYNTKERWCLMQLSSHEDVKTICDSCKDFEKFRGILLTVERYYEPLEDLLNKTVVIHREVVQENIDRRKYEFSKTFEKRDIEKQFEEQCARLTWGETEEKVKFTFSCQHNPIHTVDVEWRERVSKMFSVILESIKVIERSVDKSLWEAACAVQQNFDGLLIKQAPQLYLLTIIGYESECLRNFLSELDAIKLQPKATTITRDVKDEYKLEAFQTFGLAKKISTAYDIQIDVDIRNSRLKLTGAEDNIQSADKEITKSLLAVNVQRYEIKDEDYVSILSTGPMKDEIEIMMKKYDHCSAKLNGSTLIVLWEGNAASDRIYNDVLELIQEETVKLQGKVESEEGVKKMIKELVDEFCPFIKLSYKVDKDKNEVIIFLKCPNDYVDPVSEKIHSKMETCLVRTEKILVSPFFVHQMFENKYFEALEKDIKTRKLDPKCLIRYQNERQLKVHGKASVRDTVKSLVKQYIEKINVSWTCVEEDGIDVYFDQTASHAALKELQQKNKCSIRIATRNEMKEKNIHCIALMDSGQAIFAGTDDMAELLLPVDVVVNAANEDLDHQGGLAKQLSKKGGKAIQRECSAYIHAHGKLKEGDVFMGTAGKMNYLKIAHAVGPRWKDGDSNERQVLAEAIANVFKVVTEEKTSILKSIALPLLSSGIFSFPRAEAAKVIMDTLMTRLADFKSIREIYFYDRDPAVVRTIQDELETCFGKQCYHLPVENIRVGKGTMTKLSNGKCLLKRTGTRALPLPGKKRIVIAWGRIESTSADVLVNTTVTAPVPSGRVNIAFNRAAGVQFDLNHQIKKAFESYAGKGGNVVDGTMVVTNSGRVPCKDIYHLKIASWDDNTGVRNVCDYIKTCLQEAVRAKYKSIAFPTIGTSDSGYKPVEVAKASIRTIGEFMKLHINSALKEIKIVIFENDVACTAAFEHVIETMYKQRPHRLEAVIEETNDYQKGKEEEKDTRPSPYAADSTGANPKGAPSTFKVNNTVGLELIVGHIEGCKDDIIVCTSSSFPKLYGAISAAIKKAGGSKIEQHCTDVLKKYPDNGIAIAPGGRLKCTKVYIVKLENYKKPEDIKKIYGYVTSCLEEAGKGRFSSIAFPTIGTGGFGYPDTESARKTLQAIKDFFNKYKTTITTVRIIMYPTAHMSIQTFTSEAGTVFGVPAGLQPLPPPQQVNTDDVYVEDTWSVPNTKTRIEISFGNLEAAQADVILNTTTSFPNLNGIISTCLTRVAGVELQKECVNYPNKVTYGDIAETKGYKLQCQKVFHFVLPSWESSAKQKMIHDKMSDCLHLMKQSGLHSIAIPSIGTGGYKYEPSMVAHGIYEAVRSFGQTCPDHQCLVKLVLFQPAKDVNKHFTDILGKMRAGQPPKKGVRFNDDGDNEDQQHQQQQQPRGEIKARKVKDFVLFQIVSDDPKKERNVIEGIKKKIEEDTKSVDISLKKDKIFDDIEILTHDENKKHIKDIGEGYTTKVDIVLEQKKISLKGMGENVNKCHAKILEEIRDLRSKEGQRKVGNVVDQFLEWCYTEDDGKLWVPYPRRIAYKLEDAYKQNEDKTEFKDSDDTHYVVDFKAMTEDLKGSKDKTKSVDVVRKDLTIGDIDPFPVNWSPMGPLENLKEVILQATGQEYKDVEASFKATIGNRPQTQIVQVKRIQNQALYQQYSTKRKQLQAGLKGVADIERTLWHGIKEASEAAISSNGFNRGYSGQTFGKLWYGEGSYFAVTSGYSAQDTYSPAGNDGNKRMYMVKVLTGQTTRVDQGYKDRFAPNLPGSSSDRYNSVCDDVNNPKEFVIFSDIQAYPEYMIWFK